MSVLKRPLRFDIYPKATPTSGLLVSLSRPISATFRQELFGIPICTLVMDRNDAQVTAANFNDGNYVDVVDTGLSKSLGGFFMPAGTATLLSEREKGGQYLTIKGPVTLSYIGKCEWLPVAYVAPGGGTGVGDATNSPRSDGLWHWPNNRYGSILERAILEAQDPDRPDDEIPAVSIDFNYSTDSASASFTTFAGDYTQAIGTNYIDTLADMIRLGLTILMKPDFTLQAYQGTYGTDRHSATFASGKVRFAAGVNIASDTLERSLQPNVRVKTLVVQGKSSVPADFVIVTDSGGSGEAFLNYGVSNDVTVLTSAGNTNLAMRQAQTDTARFRIVSGDAPLSGHYIPSWPGDGGNFWLGDTVTIHTGTGELDYNNQSIRVAAIEWQMDATGLFDVFVELGSTFYDFSKPGSQTIAGTVPSSQPCTCGPVPAPGCLDLSATGYEHFTWEAGQETVAHPYPGQPTQMFARDAGLGGFLGAAGTSWCGNMGAGVGDAASGSVACVAGLTYNFDGWMQGFGQSHPCTAFGFVNMSWGVNWYDASNTLVGSNVIGSHANVVQDSAFVHASGSAVAPGGAVYFRLGQGLDGGLGCQTTSNKLDEVTITVGAGGTDPLCIPALLYGPDYIPGLTGYYLPFGSTVPPPTAAEVPFTPTGTVSATDVQAAIAEVASEAANPAFATPAIVHGTAAAAGAASTVIRSDSTIVTFDATVPVTQALGDSAATGSVALAARRDHKHGMPGLSSATPLVDSGSGAVGTALPSSREDHVHPASASVPAGTAYYRELLMQDGVTSPPEPIENEAGDDWLYSDTVSN